MAAEPAIYSLSQFGNHTITVTYVIDNFNCLVAQRIFDIQILC